MTGLLFIFYQLCNLGVTLFMLNLRRYHGIRNRYLHRMRFNDAFTSKLR